MAENKEVFNIEIISPDELFYTGQITFVEFTTVEGEVGIYKNHIPTTTILEPCVLTFYNAKESRKCAIMGGFVEIQKEKITILAEDAQWPEEIDVERAEKSAQRAQDRIEKKVANLDVGRAETALKRAMARINTTK